jgi:transposase/DNA-directed RNA polymerase specialized sigma24 family protein
MDRRVDDATSFSSSERQEWEREQREIEKVAARFPSRYTDELEAELAATLVELKRRRPPGIRDWKAYLITALRHRALSLVDKWRAQERREKTLDHFTETPEPPVALEGSDPGQLESRLALSKLRSKLDVESYGLLLLWAVSKKNQSRVARLLCMHRNTIRQRLRKIMQTVRECPIENVSGHSAPIRRRPSATVQPTAGQWEQLACLGEDSRLRYALRARFILALATGQSYAQIERRLKTTPPTISRWKRRFEKQGIAGLKTRHQGRKSQLDAWCSRATWQRVVRRMRRLNRPLSCRKIAKELGISKSTAQRFLKADRA